MTRSIGTFWRRLAVMLGLAAMLSACATITLVPAYDEQIDSGLTTLYGDTVAFVDRMIAAAGTPAGTYAANSDFYDTAGSRVEALIVRAEAHRVLNDCPSTAILTRAFAKARLPADVQGQIGALPKDDCQVVLLRLIKDQYGSMRTLHQLRGAKGFPPEARAQLIDGGGVGALLRAAITVEIAKRATPQEQRK